MSQIEKKEIFIGYFEAVSERAQKAIQEAGGRCYQPFVDYEIDPDGERWGPFKVYLPLWELGTERHGERYKLPNGQWIEVVSSWHEEGFFILSIR